MTILVETSLGSVTFTEFYKFVEWIEATLDNFPYLKVEITITKD